MSDRQIHCIKCSTYLGVIRDARLMKGILFLCPKCNISTLEDDHHQSSVYDFGKIFEGILGNKK